AVGQLLNPDLLVDDGRWTVDGGPAPLPAGEGGGATVHRPPSIVHSAGTRLIEDIFARLCEETFGGRYHTLMVFSQWDGAFRHDRAALGQVDNPLVGRGQAVWQGTKKELADMLGRSGSALDNFLANFPELIEIQQPWHGREGQGAVRFALHPLEREIVGLVEERGERKPVLLPRTAKAEQVPALGYPALQEE